MNFDILGTGMYVPERIVANRELETMVDTTDEWIVERVGVRERRVSTGETASDLAVEAARRALENAGTAPGELDLILCATVSGEYASPGVSCMVQSRLGAKCPAFDINAACSAFLYLLETAAGFFARGGVKKVLVVGAEQMSRIMDWTDRATCVIFGDGAGAAVLGAGTGYLDSVLQVKGGDDVIRIPRSIGASPFWKGEQEHPFIHMQGQETFKFAVSSICRDIRTLLKRSGLTVEDLRWIVPHQANRRIVEFAAERLSIPMEKFYLNIERYGNTSSASIPMALDELNRSGKLQRGDLVLMSAFGGGLASAACLIRW